MRPIAFIRGKLPGSPALPTPCRGTLLLIVTLLLAGEALGGKSPTISSLSPTSGAVGVSVTINGANFGSSQGSSTITFNGTQATAASWKTGAIVATVPAAATSGSVVVKVGGVASNSVTFTVTPVISSLAPTSAPVGTAVTISGSGFGTAQGSSTVSFNGKAATPTGWTDASISAPVPSGASTGPVVVTVNGASSSGVTLTVPPTLVSIAVSPQNSSLPLPLKQQFTATGTYSDGSTKDLTLTATWTSGNTALATVSFGLATSRSQGSAAITATYAGVSGSSTLTVTPAALLSATITPPNIFLPPGATQQFTATGSYSDGSTQNITASVTWSSSNTAVATVSASGLATGVSAGTATMTAAAATGYTSATGVTVTSGGPPTITASVFPAPNAAGWNNTSVTVTFACTPGSAPITSCTAPQTISSEGANQVVTGTVTDTAGNSASTNVTLNIDMTPPALAVNSPLEGNTFTTATITASGTLSDALSGVSSVTCNGASVTPAASFSCSISLNPGLNLVVVRATDVAGNAALTKIHVNLNTSWPAPTSLQVAPAGVNLLVGQTQQFTAIDNQGRPRPDATWTVSNTSLATISTGASPVLTALAGGNVTLTATAQGISAQAQVNILSGTLSPGTATWSAASLPGLVAQSFLQATPWPGAPDLYDLEGQSSGNGSNPVLRAFTLDGQQLWQQAASGPNAFLSPVGDDLGGLIVMSSNSSGANLLDLDGETGGQVWQYPLQNALSNFAIRPADGAILAVETDTTNQQLYVDIFDANTGQRTLSFPIPQSTGTYHEEWHCVSNVGVPYTVIDDTSSSGYQPVGPIAIDEQGNAVLEYLVTNGPSALIHSTCYQYPEVGTEASTETISLLTISPDGSTSVKTIASSNLTQLAVCDPYGNCTYQDSGSWIGDNFAVPDGQGGALVSWNQQPFVPSGGQTTTVAEMITDTSANGGGTFQLPLTADPSQLVVGENGTAFASNNVEGVVSFNFMNSGSVNWTYPPSSGYQLAMLSSLSGNGLAAQLLATTNGPLNTVVRLDPGGNASIDPWGATTIQNYGGGLWFGISAGQLVGILADPVELSSASWYAPDGNGGKAAKQNVSVPDFSQSAPNQTTIGNMLQKLIAAIPGNAACNNWLQGTGAVQGLSGAEQMQNVLSANNFGHGTVYRGTKVNYVDAFSGNRNSDGTAIPGVPFSAVFVVNDVSGFFNQFKDGDQTTSLLVGWRDYTGGTLRAQATILIHETAHQILVSGFQPDFDNRKAQNVNDKAVDKNCRNLIEGLQ